MTSFRDWPPAGLRIIRPIRIGKLSLEETFLIGYLCNLAILVQGKYLVQACSILFKLVQTSSNNFFGNAVKILYNIDPPAPNDSQTKVFVIRSRSIILVLSQYLSKFSVVISDAASVWAGWALAHPKFGSSVNPNTTMGADYAHHITASPTGFEIPAASLKITYHIRNY